MARTTRNYETVGWQDGTVLQPAKVTVQGTEYEVTPQVESGTTPVNANNLRHMDNEIQRIVEEDIPSVLDVELIAVSDTAPIEFIEGDKYYNTEDKKIYTATSSAWENAETPEEGISYIVFATQTSYAWNGTDLISVGGGSGSSDIIIIGDETEATEDTKIIIEDEDLDFQPEEIVNEESNSTQKGYSANYSNKAFGGTILWDNPNPTSNFDAQTITLSNDDYDILEIYYRSGASSTDYVTSTRIIKGNSAILQINHISSNVYHRSRKMDYVNDSSYSVANGQQCPTNSSSIDNNAGYIIPLYIIGYKTGLFS